MKGWYLLMVALVLTVSAYFIITLNPQIRFPLVWENLQEKSRQADLEKRSDVTSVSSDLLDLRRQHHLRPLTQREDGKPIRELPRGVYGFSLCNVVSVKAERADRSPLEIHKHEDGITYYVGYASDEHIGKYLARQKNFHILVSPLSSDRASSLFEIPIDFVAKCEERHFKGRYQYDLFVTSIPELHS